MDYARRPQDLSHDTSDSSADPARRTRPDADRQRGQVDALLRTDVAQAKGPGTGGKRAPAATGGGEALDAGVRADMEASFGTDFGDVRVHQDGNAEQLGAAAYAQGTNVHFAAGAYAPDTEGGEELIGHELAHVVQQRKGGVARQGKGAKVSVHEDQGLEHEADEQGARAAAGETAHVTGATKAPHKPDELEDSEEESEEVQAKLEWDRSKFERKSGSGKALSSDQWKDIIRALDVYHDIPLEVASSQQVLHVLQLLQGACFAWLDKHKADKPKDQKKNKKRSTVVEDLGYRDVPHEMGLVQSKLEKGDTVKQLGGGQVGSVSLVDFGGQQRVFKDQETGYQGGDAPAAFHAGIPTEHNSLLGNRAVASSKLDELFGSNILTKTDFATRKDEEGKTKSGIAMEVAPGVSPQQMEKGPEGNPVVFQRKMNYDSPDLQRQLATLQLLDAITGQVDRHGGNFFVQWNGDQVQVKGIDNDLSFGKNKQDISSENSEHDKYQGFPAYVDRAVAQRVRQITEQQLRQTLAPLLTPGEVEATVVRFKQVLQFLRNLENMQPSHLLTPDQWNAHTAQSFDDKSYYGQMKGSSEQALDRGLQLPFDPGQDPRERKEAEEMFMQIRIKCGELETRGMPDLREGKGNVYQLFGVQTPAELQAAVNHALDQLVERFPAMRDNVWVRGKRQRAALLTQG